MEANKYLRVLIVDDEEIDQIIAVRLIEKLQLTQQMELASNGEQAFDLIRKWEVGIGERRSLILLDINMPIMDGFTFLDKCKQIGYLKQDYTHFILLTSSTHPEDRKRAASYSITNFLIKPLTVDKLLATIGTKEGLKK